MRSGSVDHLGQGVDALHLRGQQVVARAARHARVPGDAQLGEQRERLLADLGQQVERGELGGQAEVVRRPG